MSAPVTVDPHRSEPAAAPNADTRWIFRLFFLSGLSGILFEVLWTRVFTFVLGSGVQSVSAVVTSFMLGLGLGSAWLGRRADRGGNLLRLYGAIELGVAVLGALAFFLFQHVDGLYGALFAWAPAVTVKWLVFALAFVFISIPATLIGGTLPVLARATVSTRDELKSALAGLYAINTLGAAAGAVLTLGLVFAVGYAKGYAVALGINVLTAAGALWRSRSHPPVAAADDADASANWPVPSDLASARIARIVLPAFAVSGFCALVYEVVWFRAFDFLLLGRLTTFACVLAIYLLGISLGSMAQGRARSSGDDVRQFIAGQLSIGVLGLCSFPLLSWVTSLGSRPLSIAVFFALIFVTTLVLGALFPVAGKLCVGPVRVLGRATGTVYSANTLGAVLGSFATAFVLIPAIGTGRTLLLAAVLNLLIASWVQLRVRPTAEKGDRLLFAAKTSLSPFLAVVACAALALSASTDWFIRYCEHASLRPGFHVIASKDGALQTVMVAEDAHGERVLMGGPFQSGETVPARRQTQRLQSHLPMLVHRDPKRVLEIGYGVGELARTVLRYHPERLDLVEIDENMVPMADAYFDALTARPSQAPNVHLTVMDGRHFLRMSHDTWDVVMSDSMILASEGSLRLYTEEHFREARRHLNPGGVMLLWLPLNVGTTKALVIAKTFVSVFPQSMLWLPLGVNTQEAFLVGFRDEAQIDLARFEQKFDEVTESDLNLCWSQWCDPALFFGSFRMGPEQLAHLVQKVPLVNRDMAPVLDFLPQEPSADVARFVERLVAQDPAFILPHLVNDGATVTRASLAVALAREHQADEQFIRGVAAFEPYAHASPEEVFAHRDALTAHFREALATWPNHPAAAAWTSLVLDLAPSSSPPLPPEQLRSTLEEALALNPSDATAAEALARLALSQHQPDKARDYVNQVHALAPYSRAAAELGAQFADGALQ